MEDMQGKIRAFVRVRETSDPSMSVVDEYTVRKKSAKELGDEYAFDRAFDSNVPNLEVMTCFLVSFFILVCLCAALRVT